jgi:RecB family exonuclease
MSSLTVHSPISSALDATPRWRLTASALALCRSNPQQFYARYPPTQTTDSLSVPALAGLAVHAAVQRFYECLTPPQRNAATLEALLRAEWSSMRAYADVDVDERQEIFWGQRALTMMRRYANSAEARFTPWGCEVPVSVRLAPQLECVGRVDRVDVGTSGVVVTDYKTGFSEIRPGELRNDVAAWIYALGVEDRLRRPVRLVRWLYLQDGQAVCWRPTEADLDRA